MINGKVAIITGASSGIGEATAITLAKAGVKVAIGARRVDRLEELSKKIIANGGEVFFQKLDVTKNEECKNQMAARTDRRTRNDEPRTTRSLESNARHPSWIRRTSQDSKADQNAQVRRHICIDRC